MHGSAADLGLIFAVGGIGAMTSAIVMGNRQMPRRNMTFIYVVWTDLDARDRRLRARAVPVAGHGRLLRRSTRSRARGRSCGRRPRDAWCPGRLLGRVSSFDWFISIGLVPVSYAFTGPIAGALGAKRPSSAPGSSAAPSRSAFLFLPGMRDIERSGVLVGTAIEPTRATRGSGPSKGRSQPISAGQGPFPVLGNFRAGPKVRPFGPPISGWDEAAGVAPVSGRWHRGAARIPVPAAPAGRDGSST